MNPSPRLADHLRQARHRRFVGREEERGFFREALRASPLPFHVLYVYGPGGVGKTALLQEFQYLCEQPADKPAARSHEDRNDGQPESDGQRRGNGQKAPQVPAYYLDARNLEPSLAALMHAVRRKADPALQGDERFVLMIDTIEALAPIERSIREDFLPQMPATALVVLAGRQPPPPAWRADPGLQELMHVVALRNLPPEASRQYLVQRKVPSAEHEAVLNFAYGHPLALSLAADSFDQNPEQPFDPEATPDLVSALMERFIASVPSSLHRRAVEACAITRVTSEALLAQMLDRDDVRAIFEWLRGLSFVEAGPHGLFPHDVAREVLTADLRWRRPEVLEQLHQAARQYYTERLQERSTASTDDVTPYEDVLTNYLFLYRDNPVVEPLFTRLQAQWKGRSLTTGPPRKEDWPHLEEMTRDHEGGEAVRLLRYWRERQPEGGLVVRDEEGAPAGFSFSIALQQVSEEDRTQDPAVEAACRYLDENAPLREGEAATLFRFWMDREAHQDLSPVQSLISSHRVRHYLTTPRLAFSFVPCADPEQWALVFAYADLQRIPEAGFEVGGHAFGMFGHDWRATPPTVWLDRLAEREITPRSPDAVPPAEPAPMLVLSQEDFAREVKAALQGFTRPDELLNNSLLRARLVAEEVGKQADPPRRVEALRELIRAAAQMLEADPQEAKFYRALRATYLEPEGTQEEAAARLDVPFSTFRRHLRRGTDHVTEVLWQRETGGPSPVDVDRRDGQEK